MKIWCISSYTYITFRFVNIFPIVDLPGPKPESPYSTTISSTYYDDFSVLSLTKFCESRFRLALLHIPNCPQKSINIRLYFFLPYLSSIASILTYILGNFLFFNDCIAANTILFIRGNYLRFLRFHC